MNILKRPLCIAIQLCSLSLSMAVAALCDDNR